MAWMIRPVLPAGASFGGQLVYNMTNFEINDSFQRSVQSLSLVYADKYINKETGFEKTKHRISNAISGQTDIIANVSIMLVGNLERWLCQALERLAIGCNGSGMRLSFRDTWATQKQYTCKWVNAGDFVDNSELICGASMDLAAFEVQAL